MAVNDETEGNLGGEEAAQAGPFAMVMAAAILSQNVRPSRRSSWPS
jgi:hypothetical protein